MASKYYDGTKLLSLKDMNGNKPEIYICTTNRTGGKTTYFGRLCVNKFIQKGEKFCLIYRYNYELDDIATKFFKDINSLFFTDKFMRSERRAKGIYHELFLCDAGVDAKDGFVAVNGWLEVTKVDSFEFCKKLADKGRSSVKFVGYIFAPRQQFAKV